MIKRKADRMPESRKPFTKKRIFFLPSSVLAWVALGSSAAYLVYEFVEIDTDSHSASDTLINFAYHVILVWSLYSVFAMLALLMTNKSHPNK
ncbi:MAG: hypothetical protein ACHQK8_08515 [Bacteroidia bacterium]